MHFEAHIEKHRINVENILHNSVGVAEHADIMDTIEKELQVIAGVKENVSVGLTEDIILTLQKNKRDDLSFELSLSTQVLAPINAMDKAGTLKVIDDQNNVIAESDLVYLDSVEELGFFQRLFAILWNWIKSLFV